MFSFSSGTTPNNILTPDLKTIFRPPAIGFISDAPNEMKLENIFRSLFLPLIDVRIRMEKEEITSTIVPLTVSVYGTLKKGKRGHLESKTQYFLYLFFCVDSI